MIVRCIRNKLADFEEGPLKDSLKEVVHLDESEDIGLKIGDLYTVYGVNLDFLVEGMPFYYICESSDSSYPVPMSAAFFEIIDSRLSKHWIFSFDQNQTYGLFSPEWANNSGFYERLVDGNQNEEAIFSNYKKLMESE
jgi:hypothetical protein